MSSHSGRVDDGKTSEAVAKAATQQGKATSAGSAKALPDLRLQHSTCSITTTHHLSPQHHRLFAFLCAFAFCFFIHPIIATLKRMTRRRWIADTWNATRTQAALTGDQAQHLARVLRAQPGQIFDVVADGFLHRAEVTSVNDNEVVFTLHEEHEAEAALPIHLLLAVFKFDHMEWGIEKATELGAARITPILARRTEKHLAQAATKRVERWRRIVREAAQQSRRTDVPEIDDPITLKQLLSTIDAPVKLLLAETEEENTLRAALEAAPSSASIALAIGPEGGWAAEEMQLFRDNGWHHVTLGPRILRAETAAIAALAITSAMYG